MFAGESSRSSARESGVGTEREAAARRGNGERGTGNREWSDIILPNAERDS